MSQVVIGDILPYTQATAILNQTVFGTNWTANTESDVTVYRTPVGGTPNDATQILQYPSDFSVAFIGAEQQVQVTLVTAANAGDIITITRQTPADRLNLYTNTNFVPSMLNNDFGILTLVDQQAQLVNQKIGPRYNYSATIRDVVDTIIPILAANQFWVKDGNNDQIVAVTLNTSAGSGTVNIGAANQLAWYEQNGSAINGLPTANNSILVTSNIGVPSLSNVAPAGLTIPQPTILQPNIVGFTDGSSASPGDVGQLLTATASGVVVSNNTAYDVLFMDVPDGDWDMFGSLDIIPSVLCTDYRAWISTTSSTIPSPISLTTTMIFSDGQGEFSIPAPTIPFRFPTTTRVYLSGFNSFTSGVGTAGGTMYARRRR